VPPVPATSDPEGKNLVEGAVVAAAEKSGGIRLYKVVKVNWFPDPVGEELVMIAYQPKASTFEQAAKLWSDGRLTIALPKVRVAKHMFMRRDHRVLVQEDVSDRERDAQADAPQRAGSEGRLRGR
jgi:hypothetical protein